MGKSRSKYILLLLLVGVLVAGLFVLKPWHKDNHIKKITLSLAGYEMTIRNKDREKFNSDIEGLLALTNTEPVTEDFLIEEVDKFFDIKIIFADGEIREGRMTTGGLIINDEIYRYVKDKYTEILTYIEYPKIVGADAQIVKLLNEETIYVKWKDDDLAKVFGKRTKINCKEATFNQFINGSLKIIRMEKLQKNSDITVDIMTYEDNTVTTNHIQLKV